MITTYFLEFDAIPTYTFPAKTAYPCGNDVSQPIPRAFSQITPHIFIPEQRILAA